MALGSRWSARSMGTPFSSQRAKMSLSVFTSGPPDSSSGKPNQSNKERVRPAGSNLRPADNDAGPIARELFQLLWLHILDDLRRNPVDGGQTGARFRFGANDISKRRSTLDIGFGRVLSR